MSHDNGSAAQPNRFAKESYAQKVYVEFVSRLMLNSFGIRTH
jgi:hypothetical protein